MKNEQKKEPTLGKETAHNKTNSSHNSDSNNIQKTPNNNFSGIEKFPNGNRKIEIDNPQDKKLNGLSENKEKLLITDFYAFAPDNRFICAKTNELWPEASIDKRLPRIEQNVNGVVKKIKPSAWLAHHRSIEQMTWYPGYPQIIVDKLIKEGSLIDARGYTAYNLYTPPNIKPGNPEKAELWVNHVRDIYGEEANHLFDWFAHRVQYPGVKINHAIVLGGAQGIGKDTIIEPLKKAVGPWNFAEVNPARMMGRFNSFVKSVILRVSEVRDMGEVNRYAFYETLKNYIATPPDTFLCDEKNRKEYHVANKTGVIITTNHKTGGFYLPEDDRRHFIAWSGKTRDDFDSEYWSKIWGFYEDGGYENVAAFLLERDLSNFDPKSPPPKTNAFYEIVDSNRAPESSELKDALDKLGNPRAITKHMIIEVVDLDFQSWLKDKRNQRLLPQRFESVGYSRFRNPDASDGMWNIQGKRENVYVLTEIPENDRKAHVDKLKSKANHGTNNANPL